jgi:hypothetical protein
VKPLLRKFLIISIVLVSVAMLGVGWIASAFLFSPCQYDLTHERGSPSGRYVAEIYGASCGMGGYRDVVTLRDRSALSLARVDGTPPGTIVANDFMLDEVGENIFWDGEGTLVLQYAGNRPPELERSEWGGVRIEARRAP